MVWNAFDPLRDEQEREESGRCAECEAELYGSEAESDEYGRVLCPECREAADKEYDAQTALMVMTAYDREVRKVLASDPCDKIWNALAQRFPLPA